MSDFRSRFVAGPLNAHYDGAYSDTELRWRRLGAIDKASNLAALLGAEAIESVLEVGCGTGSVLAAVKRAGIGSTHVGIDVSDPSAHRDPGTEDLDLRQFDGARLPFADNSFDLVYSSHVLEHVPDERGFLAEIHRVAKRTIYIEVPCDITVRASQEALQKGLNIGHINAYTPASFALTLATSDVRPDLFRLFDHSFEVHAFYAPKLKARVVMGLRRLLLRLAPTVAPHVFVYHCGAICSKGSTEMIP